jgi:hypothetical protein
MLASVIIEVGRSVFQRKVEKSWKEKLAAAARVQWSLQVA